jgi:hypothetical protein
MSAAYGRQRSIKIASISKEAKQAADEAGLDTQKARLAIAAQPLKKQLEKVADLKRQREAAKNKLSNDPRPKVVSKYLNEIWRNK